MEIVEKLQAPNGWLVDPHNKWAIHFDCKMEQKDGSPEDFTIDMWGIVPDGKPMIFKSRRKVSRKESFKTWDQLTSSDWVEFDYEKNKIAL